MKQKNEKFNGFPRIATMILACAILVCSLLIFENYPIVSVVMMLCSLVLFAESFFIILSEKER